MEISKRSSDLLTLDDICSRTFTFVSFGVKTLTLYFNLRYIQWSKFLFIEKQNNAIIVIFGGATS